MLEGKNDIEVTYQDYMIIVLHYIIILELPKNKFAFLLKIISKYKPK